MKKIFMTIGGLLICAAATVHASGSAELTVGGADTGITKWGMSKESPTYAIKDSTKGLYISGADSSGNALYFNIDDSVAFGQIGSAAVTVQYYDEGTSEFYLSYTQFDGSSYTHALKKSSITCTDTKTWKTTTFNIDNVVFDNRIDKIGGADFYLGVDGTNTSVTIKSVKLAFSGTPTFLKVTASTDNYGNIFTQNEQKLRLDIKKLTQGATNATIKWKVLYDGETVSTGTDEAALPENTSVLKAFNFKFSKYGLYELRCDITADGVTHKVKLPFSIINKSTQQNDKLHICAHFAHNQFAEPEKAVEAIKQAGFGGVRDALYWFVVEKEEDKYEIPTFAKYFTTEMKSNGMDTLMVLTHGNNLHGGIENVPITEEDINAFAAYCAAVAKEYKGVVKYYEIWNEFCDRYENRTEAGEAYAKILAAASKAIKAADPDAKIVAMAMPGNWENFVTACMDTLKAQGDEDCFDVVSLHPYQLLQYDWYKDFMTTTKNLTGGKEVWFSEHGYHTGTSDQYGTDDFGQAVSGVQDYVMSMANNYCTRYYWYDFMCDGTDAVNREHNFGLLRSEESEFPAEARPAYVAMAALNKLLGQSEFSKYTKTASGVHLYKFTDKDGRNSFVFWGTEGSTVTIDAGAKSVDQRDMYSNITKTLENESGSYTVTVAKGINYLTDCDIEKKGVLNVVFSGNELCISGRSEFPEQDVTLLLSSETNPIVYLKQLTSNENRGFSFTADTDGNDELSVKLYYGDLYTSQANADISVKLVSDGKTISSLNEIKNSAGKVIVKVNKPMEIDLDVYTATYNGAELTGVEKKKITAGTTGEIEFPVEITDENELSCFVWDTGMNSIKSKIFKQQGEKK